MPVTSVSAIAVLDLAHELIVRQVVAVDGLARCSVDLHQRYLAWRRGKPATPPVQEQRLDERYLLWLWQTLEQRECAEVAAQHALAIGSVVNADSIGVLANWISHCANLGEALDTFIANSALMNPSERWQVSLEKDAVLIQLQFAGTQAYPAVALLRSASALCCWVKHLSGLAIKPRCITVSPPYTPYAAMLADYFACEIQQGSDVCLSFALEILTFPVGAANAYMRQLLAGKAKALACEGLATQTLTAQLLQLLRADLAHYARIEACCTALHMSRSTLFRRLKLEGTTYTQLLRRVRLEQYQALLARAKPVAEMHEPLGFAEPSSFYKFVKGSATTKA